MDTGCKFEARKKGPHTHSTRHSGDSESSPSALCEIPKRDGPKRKEELL